MWWVWLIDLKYKTPGIIRTPQHTVKDVLTVCWSTEYSLFIWNVFIVHSFEKINLLLLSSIRAVENIH